MKKPISLKLNHKILREKALYPYGKKPIRHYFRQSTIGGIITDESKDEKLPKKFVENCLLYSHQHFWEYEKWKK